LLFWGEGSGSLFLYYYIIPATPLRTQFKRISARGEAIYGVFFSRINRKG
jgi:hypothetical protein